ncbi:hypothetical protein J6590_070037 [Homalodisca vitripennis]|nr:hypothetical protein J6590_070037 [Homalodisca vitripennis]
MLLEHTNTHAHDILNDGDIDQDSILKSFLDCPSLLSGVDFRIPSGTRSRELFGRRQYSRNYDFHGPLARMMRIGNRHCGGLDLFHDGVSTIRRGVLTAAQQDST